MNEATYRIKYKKGNFEVEVQGDKEWVEEKFEELTNEEQPISSSIKEEKTVEDLPKTLVEFLEIRGNPKKHTDIAAVFAYWLLKAEKTSIFNGKDMATLYERTRTAKPKNLSDIIYRNVKKHIFAEAKEGKDGYKAYQLTRKGEEYVEQMK
jgi:hypothetical protein